MGRILPRNIRFHEHRKVEFYFKPPVRSENSYYLWEYFDKVARYIENLESDEERLRFFPTLNHELAEQYANGAYTVEQISRFIENHFLDIEKEVDKVWTPTVILVPLAKYRSNELVVEYKILYDRAEEKNSYANVSSIIDYCVRESATAILLWLLQDVFYNPLTVTFPIEHYLEEPQKSGVIMHETDFFEYELRQKLFIEPLLSNSLRFSKEHAHAYYLPGYIRKIIDLLQNEEFVKPIVEKSGVVHIYKKPLFLLTVGEGLHALKPLMFHRKNKQSDLFYHYIIQAYVFQLNCENVFKKIKPESYIEHFQNAVSFNELVKKSFSEIYSEIDKFRTIASKVIYLPIDENSNNFEAIKQLKSQTELFIKLHSEMGILSTAMKNVFIQMRYEEIIDQIKNQKQDLVIIDRPLFKNDEYDDALELEKNYTDILEKVKANKKFLYQLRNDRNFFATEENIFRIYTALKDTSKSLHEEIAYLMIGELSNKTGKSVDELLQLYAYSTDEIKNFEKAIIKSQKKKETKNETHKYDTVKTDVRPFLVLFTILVLVFSSLTWIVELHFIISLVIALISGLIAFKIADIIFSRRVRKSLERDGSQSSFTFRLSAHERVEIHNILKEYIPAEAVAGSKIVDIISRNVLVKFYPNIPDNTTYVASVLENLVRNNVLLELPLTKKISYFVFPNRWSDHKVRGSFEKEIKRLHRDKHSFIDYNQYRLAVRYCKATSPHQVKRIARESGVLL